MVGDEGSLDSTQAQNNNAQDFTHIPSKHIWFKQWVSLDMLLHDERKLCLIMHPIQFKLTVDLWCYSIQTHGTERMRINSGGLIINTTVPISPKNNHKFSRVSHIGMTSENDGGNFSTEHIRFKNTGTTRGSIVVDQSSTTYNTSSDYRLKENVVYDWDATTRLKQLKPARFNFIEDETDTAIDGFIAHEVTSVVPNAVYGEKDAVEDDGAIKPQQIDQSKLVPLLVKTIQELEQRITDLENGQ